MHRFIASIVAPVLMISGCSDDPVPLDESGTGEDSTTGSPAMTTVSPTTMGVDSTGVDSTGEPSPSTSDTGTATSMGTGTSTPTDTGLDSSDSDTGSSSGDSGSTTSFDSTGSDSSSSGESESSSGGDDCGNGAIDLGEDCDQADLGGMGCLDLGMGFTAGALTCSAMCTYDTSACSTTPWPGEGQLVISEIMQNPSTLLDGEGEYFEVHNPTGTAYQLGNCTLDGNFETGVLIDADVPVPSGGYAVLAIDGDVDPGFDADYQWAAEDYTLGNGSDFVRIVCDGTTVDEVAYDDGATFPDPNGASMNLDVGSLDATANDVGGNWCESTLDYNGDLGTPGAANEVCPDPVTYTIGFCRLQFPEVIDAVQGTSVDAFGRLFIAGLTDLSGVNDPAPEVVGFVGYGPDGSDPAVDPGWTWNVGTPNVGYGPAAPGYEANNDEYIASLTVPGPAGDYDFAYRFSGDDGATFTYCDGQPEGSSNGYAAADAGQMTSQPPGAPPAVYFSEYAEGSLNNKALELFNPDAAEVSLDSCQIRIYFGGSAVAGNTISLTGQTIAADDVLVVCDDDIDAMLFGGCDLTDGGSFYNGDDAIELSCGGSTVDVIGQIGFDPGASWTVDMVSTQNQTLRRDCSVVSGDADGSDAFDPSVQWAGAMQDDFSDFGQYVCP